MRGGLPHSEIHGSKFVRNSPWLIAAYDVLHRLSAPRHPPNALKALDHSHCRCPPHPCGRNEIDRRKDQLLRDLSDRRRLSLRILRHAAFGAAFEQIFSSRCQTARLPAFAEADGFFFFTTDASRWLALVDPAGPNPSLVEPDGIEPTTSCLQSRRSPN